MSGGAYKGWRRRHRRWHADRRFQRNGKSRSFLLYTEDFVPERFTELAQWRAASSTRALAPRTPPTAPNPLPSARP